MGHIFLTRFGFESAEEPHKIAMVCLRHKLDRASEGYLRLSGTIPLLERTRRIPSNSYTLAVIFRTSIHRS